MRYNPGFTVQVERRIFRLRQTAGVDTQSLRTEWIGQLDVLFKLATSIAKGKDNRQEVGDKIENVTPKERQMWAHVAAHVALVMGNLAKGLDERQFDEDLTEMERLVDEIKKLQDQTVKNGDRTAEEKSGPAIVTGS